ncbi:hypothetical protein T01_3287 [Trichinella spiralis]|uniref:Uncharacterized protein n=1 Tax=Trichinella spiralis TaxID=6334 RepID=A0A0V1BTB2_TRISP|nr:hypothetical protein T01_12304 [Trichinella spiralis]KRY40491.1 hypothetical protein T01_3287 [Trichinella spiralis]
MENPRIPPCVIGVSSMTTSVANANGSSALRELPSRSLNDRRRSRVGWFPTGRIQYSSTFSNLASSVAGCFC